MKQLLLIVGRLWYLNIEVIIFDLIPLLDLIRQPNRICDNSVVKSDSEPNKPIGFHF